MKKKRAIVVVNFKTYKQGKSAVRLARTIEKVYKNVIVGVQASDIHEICEATKLKVYAQHVDYQKPGRETGYILPEAVKADGAKGVFLNHSEHKISFDVLKKTIKRCKDIGLKVLVFVASISEAKKVEKLKPDFLVYEPAKLVAGKKSVSKSKPDTIRKLAKNIKMDFLVGAGIKTKDDVKISLELGASGIAVSSAITKSKKPGKKLKEFLV